MKKIFFLLFFFIPCFIYGNTFHIKNVEYSIESDTKLPFSTTNIYALELQVSPDTVSYFVSEIDLDEYISSYKKELTNLRAFEQIDVSYSIIELFDNGDVEVQLNVNLKDSFHLLALPHVLSYNSNDGWKPKLKAKDSNFLGSLNTMSADIYGVVPVASDNKSYEFGAELDFIIPFKAGIFDAQWLNDYVLSYNLDHPTPEWETQTGVKFILPFNNYSLQLELNQYTFRNYDYEDFDDVTYFKEEAIFSVPIQIKTIPLLGKLYYTPNSQIYYNWDKNSIDVNNNDLSSPTISIGHKLSSSKVDWYGNYRKGINLSVNNDFQYYFQRNDFVPYISFNVETFDYFTLFEGTWFNQIGINSRINIFSYFNTNSNFYYGKLIGSKLRGIRDDQYYSNIAGSEYSTTKSLFTSNAIIINLDFPYHIFTTNFTSKLMKLFNCELQISPFIDIALCNNQITQKTFNLKDGFYAGGMEFLVYPKKWSSFTVRGSIGLDLGRYLFKDYLNMDWRKNVSKYEISIGLGLQY